MSGHPSIDEIAAAADTLRRLPRGYLPLDIFLAVAGKVTTPTMELAVFREIEGVVEIALTQRPKDDSHWPLQWHIPGTVIRSTDREGDFQTGFDRIIHDELYGAIEITYTPRRAGVVFVEIERGREVDQLFYTEAKTWDKLPDGVQFFSVDKLPINLMRHHHGLIEQILAEFKKHKKVAAVQ